jgi:hypothetical protein
LKKSSLLSHVSSKRIQLLYTPLFIEETLQYGLLNISSFKPQWEYLISLNDSKWFKHTNQILAIELGNHIVGCKYYLMSKQEIKKVIQNVPDVMNGKAPPEEYKQAHVEMGKNNLIRKELRQQRIAMRKKYPYRPYDFEQDLDHNIEWYIEKGLMKWHTNSEGYLNIWRNNRSKCRFAESHIRAALAVFFLPIVDHQLKLDINDKLDAEQLAFLEWGDIFVSDDKRFMKKAFDLLFWDSSKRFMDSEDFIGFLKQL